MYPKGLSSRYLVFFITVLILIDTGQCIAYASRDNRTAVTPGQNQIQKTPPVYAFKIIRAYPHDPRAFTQGLVFYDGYLYEGTGLYGQSSLRQTVLETGDAVQRLELPSGLFGEGITIVKDAVIQLTWRSHVGFVYARDNFGITRVFRYSTEGWGITYDGKQLIMSDGTEYLYFLHPETFEMTGKVRVYDDSGPVTKLNELEFIKGLIYANVWQSTHIAMIDPATGKVEGWIDLKELVRHAGGDNTEKTLNGIAYDATNDRLFVTGKRWPHIYEILLSTSPE